MTDSLGRARINERGSALVYILIAIALLALLTISFMEPSSQQTQSQNTFKLTSELQSQAELIRSTVQECVLLYPEGDSGAIPPASSPAVNLNHPYPIMPNDSYLNACIANPAEVDNFVSLLRCPGNPKDNPCHAEMFGGNTGKFLAPPPDLFGPWRYYSGADGVFFWTETSSSDAFIRTALNKVDENFAECEADVIVAVAATNLDSGAGTVQCPANNTCLRVWMIAKSSNIYPGDTDGDEATCP